MSSVPTVLVYEFFSGGGWQGDQVPAGLGVEALGLLWAVLHDFRTWGRVRTITVLDARFQKLISGLGTPTLPADEVFPVHAGCHEVAYLSLLKRCDAVLVIAPETDGILSRLLEQAEGEGILILGSDSLAAATAGNKATCSRLFDLAKLPTPNTRIAKIDEARRVAEQMGVPLIIKPMDGIGCEGVCLVNSTSELSEALRVVKQSTAQEQILIQSFTKGIDASVSLIITDMGAVPLSLNLQLLEKGTPCRYIGSRVPLKHALRQEAFSVACSAAGLIPGLKGYIGVDLVLTEDHVELIEINPRITTSYIALRQVARVNLAQAIWQACEQGVMPKFVELEGESVVYKDDPASWSLHG